MRSIGCVLLAILICSCSGNTEYSQLEIIRQKFPDSKPFQESQFYFIDGVRLHVRQWEPNKATSEDSKGLIYLVHGLSGSTYNWRFVAPELSRNGWSVLTVDIPPFGFSGEKQPYGKGFDPLSPDSISRAKLLWHLFDTLHPNYKGKVTIVGHSLGGRIGSYMAITRPTKVDSLVLLAPAVFGTSAVPEMAHFGPLDNVLSSGAKPVLRNLDVVRSVVDIAYGRKATDEEVFGNIAPFLREGAAEACGEWISKPNDISPVPLTEIKMPTLILWGKGDLIVPNRGRELQAILKDSMYYEISGSSHCIMDTNPDFVLNKMLEFLAKTGDRNIE